MKENKTILSTCVEKRLAWRVKERADILGVSVSEYIRRLILNDLEKQGIPIALPKGVEAK